MVGLTMRYCSKVRATLSAAKGLAQYVIAISLGFALYSISYGPWLNP